MTTTEAKNKYGEWGYMLCGEYLNGTLTPDWSTVAEFERQIAEFFGAPFAVATDSCTHGLELCLRYKKVKLISVPRRTYVSVPMLSAKLNIPLRWDDYNWRGSYFIAIMDRIIDAAVLWRRDSYLDNSFMCLSFQYQKHLSLGRGGMILCPDKESADTLRKMAYDGRLPGIPWREQDIDTMGYHYYMTPDTALLGLQKLPEAIATEPRKWDINDWPDVSKFKVFQK